MTIALLVREGMPMSSEETPWERLHRIAEARRGFLKMTQAQLTAAGGPSVGWLGGLHKKTENPGVRHRAHLEKLDAVLLWDIGTSMKLLTEDWSDWSDQTVAVREFQLIEGKDRIGNFAFMIEQKLRALDPKDAEMMIRRLALTIGLPVVGG